MAAIMTTMNVIKTCRAGRLRVRHVAILAVAVIVCAAALIELALWLSTP
jgi:hypothetical protein